MKITPTKILICGKTASGKHFLAKLLESKLNIAVAKSLTTRPQHSDEDNNHFFVSKDEFAKLKHEDQLLCLTEYNGYEYALDRKQIEAADVIVLDPLGVNDITNAFPQLMFRVIYVHGTDEDKRRLAYLSKFSDKDTAESMYEKRCLKENKVFETFEKVFLSKNEMLKKDNIHLAYCVHNNYTDTSDIFSFADTIASHMALMLRSTYILSDMIEAVETYPTIFEDIHMPYDAKQNVFTIVNDIKTEDGSIKHKTWKLTPEDIVEQMTAEPNLFFNLVTTWLSLPNKITPYNGFGIRHSQPL